MPGIVLCAPGGRGEIAGRAGRRVLGVGLGRTWRLRACGGSSHTGRSRADRADHPGSDHCRIGRRVGLVADTTAADKSFTAVTPVNAISKAIAAVARIVAELHFSALGRARSSPIGLAVAAAIGIWLLLTSSDLNVPRNLGLTLLVVALLGPILWNWYTTWGVIVLAPAATATLAARRHRHQHLRDPRRPLLGQEPRRPRRGRPASSPTLSSWRRSSPS